MLYPFNYGSVLTKIPLICGRTPSIGGGVSLRLESFYTIPCKKASDLPYVTEILRKVRFSTPFGATGTLRRSWEGKNPFHYGIAPLPSLALLAPPTPSRGGQGSASSRFEEEPLSALRATFPRGDSKSVFCDPRGDSESSRPTPLPPLPRTGQGGTLYESFCIVVSDHLPSLCRVSSCVFCGRRE